MSRASLGIGVIGAGRHGGRYISHLREGVPGFRLAGVARRDPAGVKGLARELGCPVTADYRELLALPEVEAVALVVPPSLHGEIVSAVARAGKALLLEKPAAVSVAQGRKIHRAVRAAGIPVMVAQTLRYNETVLALRQTLGRLGRIHALRVGLRFEPSPLTWLADPRLAGGGAMLHTGVHAFDLVRFLGGMEADRVRAEVASTRGEPIEDNWSAVFRLSEGRALASASGCRATASRTGTIEIAGAEGQLVADHVQRTAYLVSGSRSEALAVGPAVSTVAAVLTDFLGVARGEGANPIPLEEGLRAVAWIDAAYASARSGRAEPIAEFSG